MALTPAEIRAILETANYWQATSAWGHWDLGL